MPDDKKDNTYMWIIIAIVVVVLIAFFVWWWNDTTTTSTTPSIVAEIKPAVDKPKKPIVAISDPKALMMKRAVKSNKRLPHTMFALGNMASSAVPNALTLATAPLLPSQVLAAYSLTPVPFGAGKKIAIIAANVYTGLQADLDAFCRTFNLPKKTSRDTQHVRHLPRLTRAGLWRPAWIRSI